MLYLSLGMSSREHNKIILEINQGIIIVGIIGSDFYTINFKCEKKMEKINGNEIQI